MKIVKKQSATVVANKDKNCIVTSSGISYNEIIKSARVYTEGDIIKIDYRLMSEYRIVGKDRHRCSTGLKSTIRNLQRVKRDAFSLALNNYLNYVKQPDKNEITLDEIAMESLNEFKMNRTEDVNADYIKIYTSSIKDELGSMIVSGISIKNLKLWKRELLNVKQISRARYLKYHRVLNMIFQYAKMEEIIFNNPVELLDKKSGNFKPTSDRSCKYYTKEEVTRMINFEDNELWFTNYLKVMFFTAMRPGEANALQWDDINFEKNTITIQRSIRQGRVSGTKTGIVNEIPMAKPLRESLLEYKEKALSDIWVFVSKKSLLPFWESTGIVKTYFKPLLEKLGIEYRTLYATRATFCSLMLEAKASLTYLQRMLGHKSASTTLQYYTKAGLINLEKDSNMDTLYM